MRRVFVPLLFAIAGLFSATVQADTPQFELAIQNRVFSPSQITVPAGVKVKLVIHNRDAIPAEFESYDLSREVIVPGSGQAVVYIGPLTPGRYGFFNDFNQSATGTVIAAGTAGAE